MTSRARRAAHFKLHRCSAKKQTARSIMDKRKMSAGLAAFRCQQRQRQQQRQQRPLSHLGGAAADCPAFAVNIMRDDLIVSGERRAEIRASNHHVCWL